MANMQYEVKAFAADVEILKRPPFEAIPLTLAQLTVSQLAASSLPTGYTKNDEGKAVALAGAPINGDGEVDNTGTAIGILKTDVVLQDRPQGVILKKAYINEDVAKTHSGITVDSAVKAALPMVVFE